jgi:hypothetical protein
MKTIEKTGFYIRPSPSRQTTAATCPEASVSLYTVYKNRASVKGFLGRRVTGKNGPRGDIFKKNWPGYAKK